MASSSIPKTMKGVLVEKTGDVDVLQYKTDLPVPTPKDGEILVKNDFIGINYIDTYFRTGLYPAPKPEILGREAEGTIVSLGSGDHHNLSVGDRVVWLGTSAYAEYTCAPAAKAYKVPDGVKPGHAAAAHLQGLTALTMIRESHDVEKGEWCLVHAAAGGVGLWLCQLLKAVGARVIGTASTQEKLDLAKANGAEVVINYKETGLEDAFIKQVKDVTGGEGVAAIFDGVGKSTFNADLEVAARKGTIVSFGNASGVVPPFSIAALGKKNLKILRPVLFNYIFTREEYESYCKDLFDFILKDNMNVQIHEVYPLEDIKRATLDLEDRKTKGKLLLKP